MKSIIKNLRISPKKLNLIAEMVRGKSATEALNTLKFTPKKAAPILYKALYSAVKNAEQNDKKSESDLFIKTIYVEKNAVLKRFQPVSRGRAHPILKRSSQVKIFLEDIKS